MIDRDKVIKALECCRDCVNEFGDCNARANECPYTIDECSAAVARDALEYIRELEKAQEPKPPIITENAYGWKFYHCPKCGREFYGDRLHGRMNKTAFCDKCGQAVKWDE